MKRSAATLYACTLLLVSNRAVAQTTNATLSGAITDAAQKAIIAADIEIVNDATGVHYRARTNGEGIYTLTVLPPGSYTVQASKQGFKTIITPDIVLNVQATVSLNFTLPIGAASESVTVLAGSPLLNTTDASVSTVVDRKFIENMPLNGRSLQSLIALAPGVVQTPIPYGSSAGNSGEFSVNGQRTEANYYSVDGVSANVGVGTNGTYTPGTSGLLPNQTALGTTQSIASLDALQEFRITTSSFSAEYGRTPGGQISLQTRSGENSFHGNLFDYFRNDALDANNWFNNHVTPRLTKTAERQNDFGGTLGGPVTLPSLYQGRERTFFFYSYEGLRLRIPSPAATSEVPDTAFRQSVPSVLQAMINAFPVANGSEVTGAPGLAYFTAAYSLPSGLDTQSIRADHAISINTKIFGHFYDSSSFSDSRSQYNAAQLTDTGFVTRGVTAGLTHSPFAKLVNDARFNYTWTSTISRSSIDAFGGASPASTSTYLSANAPSFSQIGFFLNWGSVPRISAALFNFGQTQLNLVDALQIQRGRHSLKAGVDFRRLETNSGSNQFLGTATYASVAQVLANNAGSGYTQTAGLSPAEPIFRNVGLYLQDEWKVDSRTSLSLGVRWDINPPPTNGNGRIPPTLDQISNIATAQILPEGTPLWNTDYRGIAPRLGLATQLHTRDGHETVLHLGFGTFYDTGNTLGAIGFVSLGMGSRKNYTSISYPFPGSFYVLPAPSTAAPYNSTVAAFDRNLRLPYTYQWNVSIEQGLGSSRLLTVGYVASAGRQLLSGMYSNPASVNPAFSAGNGLNLIRNGSWSNYDSLQAQFQQRVARRFQALASYTWSHSIDNESNSFISYQPLLKGDSDFDVRSNFQAAVTYSLPTFRTSRLLTHLSSDWSFDLRMSSRSASPVDVYGNSYIASDGTQQYARPNVVPGVPLYLYGPPTSLPGGKALNYAAFQNVTGATGNAPRNFLRGFGATELNFAARREFAITERIRSQFRLEAFNILNHPNFGAIYNTLNYGPTQFGQAYNTLNVGLKDQSALYQQGGPRSLQLALKILF